MKGKKHGMRKITAVLLSLILLMSGAGAGAYAGEIETASMTAEETDHDAITSADGDAGYVERDDAEATDSAEETTAGAAETAARDEGTAADTAETAARDEEIAADAGAVTEETAIEDPPYIIESDGEEICDSNSAGEDTVPEPSEGESGTEISEIAFNVPYLRRIWTGTEIKTQKEIAEAVTVIPDNGAMTQGWYLLKKSVTVDSRIYLTGDTTLILGDSCKLETNGLYVPKGSILTVYCQDKENGMLVSHPDDGGAGIGASGDHPGGNVVIHGGVIKTTGSKHCAGIGGSNGDEKDIGDFTMYGGEVTATGGESGAGIGGGCACEGGKITIYDGTVKATGKQNGAGIGGGEGGNAGTITIHGGTITATGGSNSAGIGGGEAKSTGKGGTVTITGGVIHANGGKKGAGIGGGSGSKGQCDEISIEGGEVHATGGEDAAGIGGGKDADGGKITISGGTVYALHGDGAGIGGGEDGDGGTITISGGDVHSDVENPNSVQRDGAGIGGGFHSGAGGTIKITGGTVTVNACYGAGIGGGRARDCLFDKENSGAGGDISISGGTVYVKTGKAYGIGAGGPEETAITNDHDINDILVGTAGTITISGNADVTAYGGLAGVGGDSGTIRITGGTLNAIGSYDMYSGNGIWLLSESNGNIFVSGGTLNSSGIGDYGKGIYMEGGKIEITGGHVYASSPYQNAIDIDSTEGKLVVSGKGTKLEAVGLYKAALKMGSGDKLVVSDMAEVDLETKSFDSYKIDTIKSPNMTVYPEAAVRYTDDTAEIGMTPACCLQEDREKVKTSKSGYQHIIVAPCIHYKTKYVITESTHQVRCDYCSTRYEEELHELGDDYICDVCGYKGYLYLVEFNKNLGDAGGTMENLRLLPQTEYTLPECGFTAPKGYRFEDWKVFIGESHAYTSMNPGDKIILDDNIHVYADWYKIQEVKVNGVSGSFMDRIKLNYYFDFPDDIKADSGAYVTITNESTGQFVELPVKGALDVPDKGTKFSIPLVAKEASDTISAKVFDGEDNEVLIYGESGTDYTDSGVQYSLMDYFTWLEKNGKDDEKPIGAAAKDYCAAAQLYFGYNADGLSLSSAVSAVTSAELEGYKAGCSGTLPDGVSIKGISAMLEADNTLRLYLDYEGDDEGSLTFKIDGQKAYMQQRSDGMNYLASETGEWANELHNEHTYEISDKTNTYKITASVMTYARSCAIKDSSKYKKECDLGKALYLYNRAAVDAFGE